MVRVLIVDDEFFERQALKMIIERDAKGFEIVGEAQNGQEAIDFVEKNQVDIIIMDIKMPKVDGIEATRRIREDHNEIVIIMLTAYAEFDFAYNAIKLQVDDYLLKPSRPEDIVHTLKKVAERITSRGKTGKNQANIKAEFRRSFLNGDYINTKKRLREITKVQYNSIEDEIKDMKETMEILHIASEHYKINLNQNSRGEILQKLNTIHMKDEYYSLVESLIDEVFKIIIDNKLAVYPREIDYVLQFIEKNIATKINLEDAAKYMNISIHYFSKLFKSQIGINFIDYVTDRKIVKARQLIEETDIAISTIAIELGYNEANYFSKVFKLKTGLSPSEYRREKSDNPKNITVEQNITHQKNK